MHWFLDEVTTVTKKLDDGFAAFAYGIRFFQVKGNDEAEVRAKLPKALGDFLGENAGPVRVTFVSEEGDRTVWAVEQAGEPRDDVARIATLSAGLDDRLRELGASSSTPADDLIALLLVDALPTKWTTDTQAEAIALKVRAAQEWKTAMRIFVLEAGIAPRAIAEALGIGHSTVLEYCQGRSGPHELARPKMLARILALVEANVESWRTSRDYERARMAAVMSRVEAREAG